MEIKTKKTDLLKLSREIKKWSKELGFNNVGITDIELSQHEKYLEKWLKRDFQGEMEYMKIHGKKRSRPEKLFKGTKRIISVSIDYFPPGHKGKELLDHPKKAYIASYAQGRDYHKVLRKKLKLLVERIKLATPTSSRVFVDSAPVLEKAIAEKAGIGWIGKNTLLLNKRAGSYFFLGEIYTDLDLPIDEPFEGNHCGSCSACIDICPTKAFEGPYQLDSRKCISYLTIEFKGSIPKELRPLMGNRIFGCDDCQIYCPWNKFAKFSKEDDFRPRNNLEDSELADLFSWSEEEFLNKTEGSPIRRAGYECWLRNIAIALGNADKTKKIIDALNSRKNFPSALVREHVNWALNQHLG
ncbi:MAG: tRNA epoxyqueuosine(34) reductase QueG [Pseudomonadota bacterium]|nr:tRNA epoxyqueuosine(34) reductase QueG [Pseudomonadota bacterium]